MSLVILLTFVSCDKNSADTITSETSNSIEEFDYEREYYEHTISTLNYLKEYEKNNNKKVYYGDDTLNVNTLLDKEILVGGTMLLDTGYNNYLEELDSEYFLVGIRTEFCPKVNSTENMDIQQWQVYINRNENKELYDNLKKDSINCIVQLEEPSKLKLLLGKDCEGIGIASKIIDIEKKSYDACKERGYDRNYSIRSNYIQSNPTLLDCIDVQFQMYVNIEKPFVLAGNASLSDYYNYNYDDNISSKYAAVTVGDYPYNWTLYFDRDIYKDFLNQLEKGSLNVIIEAKTEKDKMFPNSTQAVPIKVITEIEKYK